MIKKLLLGLSLVAFACAGAAFAQQGGIKRTPLQKAEFPDGFVSVSAIAEIPAGGAFGVEFLAKLDGFPFHFAGGGGEGGDGKSCREKGACSHGGACVAAPYGVAR